jgi:hypothetical protein
MKNWMVVTLALFANCALPFAATADSGKPAAPDLKLVRFEADSAAKLLIAGKEVTLRKGESNGEWTLVEVLAAKVKAAPAYAVLEDYSRLNGRLLFVAANGVQLDLPKSSEPTFADLSKLYLGHSRQEISNSPTDSLAREILGDPGDPQYDEVASVFEPLRKMQTYSFVGTPDSFDKVGFLYGGRSPNFDPAPYDPRISQIRDQGRVLDGLVCGYLPVLRFVYPDNERNWTEMLAFAPLRVSNNNDRVQPVRYRVSRIENGTLRWAKYIDSYHPFPPRTDYDPKGFYHDLAALHAGWERLLQQGMTVDLPDERVANMARFALVREMMTRVHDFPKY